jgi:hypothetical protein
MTIIKRILAVIALILSAIFFLVCLAGGIGVWIANGPATRDIVGVVQAVDDRVVRGSEVVGEITTGLTTAQSSLSLVQTELGKVGTDAASNGPILQTISNLLSDTLRPAVAKISQAAAQVSEALAQAQGILDTLNRTPLGRGMDLPPGDKIGAISTALAGLSQPLDEMIGLIQGVKELSMEVAQRLQAGLSRAGTALAEAQSVTQTVSDSLAQAHAQARTLIARLPGWIDLASIVLSFVFFWMALAQASLFIHALGVLKGR